MSMVRHETPTALGGSIEDSARRIDAAFASIGDGLGHALEQLGGWAGSLEGLSGEFASSLEGMRVALAPVPASLRDLGHSLASATDLLQTMLEDGVAASRELDRLQGNCRVVGAAARNARIEMARLGRNDADDEDAHDVDFAEQLAALAPPLAETLGRCADGQRALALLLRQASETTRLSADDQLPALRALAGQIDGQLDAVGRWCRETVAAAASASRQSHKLLDTWGEAVVAVQGGDTVRQRLEHAATILRLSTGSAGGADDPAGPVLRHIAGRHVRATDLRLRGDLDIVDGALALLRSDMESFELIGQDLARALETGDAVRGLSEILERSGGAVSSCEAAHARLGVLTVDVNRLVDAFRSDAARLSQIVSSIVVVGMNARIHAHRLGSEGRVLAVIAGEIKSVVDQISSGTTPVLQALERMLSAASHIARNSIAHADNLAKLSTTVGQAVDNLSGGRERFRNTVLRLRDADAVIGAIVTDSYARQSALRALQAAVAQTALTLDAEPAPALRPSDAAWIADRLGRDIMPLYSMAEERQIHREALAAWGIEVPVEPEQTQVFEDFML